MKKSKSILLGILLVAIGILLGGKSLGIINFDLFFDGWWTLFIIIPSFVGLCGDEKKTGNIICLTIGILLLLAAQDVIDFDILWKLIVPIIIVAIGISMIFKDTINKELNEKIKTLNNKTGEKNEYCATFSGQEIKLDNEEFDGGTLTAVFGGIKMDLRNAKIKNDIVINTSSIFGGIDIMVPENVLVKVKSSSIFGGASNKTTANEKAKVTIYVNASCIFGGVEIK